MKKITALLLALILALSTAACAPKNDGPAVDPSDTSHATDTPDTSDKADTSAPSDTADTSDAVDTAEDTTADTAEDTAAPDTAKDTTEDTAKDTTEDTAKDTTPPDTAKDTTPPDTAKDTTPPDTATPDTSAPDTTPPDTTGDTTEDTTGDSTPGFGPGFQFGPGGIITPGGNGGDTTEDIPVADAGELVDQLDALCQGKTGEMNTFTESLRQSGLYGMYFGGKVQYQEGMRVAKNAPEINVTKHVVLLIEVPAGENAADYAKTLYENADPNWTICGAPAESVQYAVKGNLVLFVMSSEETANAIIAAFNG